MSTFTVTVLPIKIEPHHNADALECARIGDYRSIVAKGSFRDGDLVAYIPEGAVVPQDLIAEMGLTGRLSGPNNDRVKAVKLRGVLSQGLCYPARKGWRKGEDVAAELGIFKYEPVIPEGFDGEIMAVGADRIFKYDIENIKRFTQVFSENELVVMTEKCHGTFAMFGVLNPTMAIPQSVLDMTDEDLMAPLLVVSSKGLATKGFAFKTHSEANKNNIYVKTALSLNLVPTVQDVFGHGRSVFILGEIFGAKVQDLGYGLSKPEFRIFDIYVGNPGTGCFLGDRELDQACADLRIPRVPVIYRGPFSQAAIDEHTNGKETVSGTGAHVREGVVVRPQIERFWSDEGYDSLPCFGRVQLKSVSEGYLLRKGNTTEYA